ALSICGNAVSAFTAAVGLPFVRAASTMSSRLPSCRTIPIATSSPAAANATRRKAIFPRQIFSAGLHDEHCLTAAELAARLRVLHALVAGKLPPPIRPEHA